MQLLERITGKRATAADVQHPQPFAVRCRCGRVSEGVRLPKPQVVRCPGCQEFLFVMARSAFPPPVGAEQEVAAVRRRTKFKEASAPAVAVEPPSNWLSRPRVALAAVALFVTVTAYLGWQAQRRAKFSGELESAMADGRRALVQGDLVAAHQRLEIADRAARGLGRATRIERSATNLYAETQVWMNLSPRSLEDFFLARAAKATPWDAASVELEFTRDYRSRTLIVDGWVTRVERWVTPTTAPTKRSQRGKPIPPPSPQQIFVPTLDWSLSGENYRAELNLDRAARLDHLPPQEPTRVVFGVELSGVQRAAADPQQWSIQIVPESLVLLTVAEPLVRSGWPETDNDLTELLSRQQAHVERGP